MKSVSSSSSSVSPGRAKHLERNRVAANKCRERKKREHKQIERRLSDETEKKDLLLAQLNSLREEVWDLKNLIFQHADCQDHQINRQLAKMTETVLQSNPTVDANTGLPTSSSPAFSTGTWSDESIAGDTKPGSGAYDPNTYDRNDWTVLPAIANDFPPYESNGFTDLFENFIDAENVMFTFYDDALFTYTTLRGTNGNLLPKISYGYTEWKPLGLGVSGLVCSARDQLAHRTVAVKKLAEPFKTPAIARHMFREIKLLRQLRHENIINLTDIFISPSEDIYIVTELMATDLSTILKAKKVEDQFAQYFMYQIMRGLKYLHSAGVIHRDLKPSNILVNENCDLKICDFGLARIQESHMTGYVSTRYYRAPEIMLTWRKYTEKVDMWSAGCIFAELFLGEPLFPGTNHINQFCVITDLLGNPPKEVVNNITSENTLNFINSLPKRERKPISQVIPKANADAAALIDKMLEFDPQVRISATEALSSPYLAPYHDPNDEPVAAQPFDWAFLEANLPADIWKTIMYNEVLAFHSEMNQTGQSGPMKSIQQVDGMDIG
ncbi:bZIP transcription factor, bZIP-1 [Penicillium griseofulvum]|uniref:Mitogen-activated protein kinase n=1 Tax=Penicillium patulum TaxID=5078 RepID=A0A135LXQ8_PENPA|nr:bZIP transcription factor, bZIP-1 [Penicillium griseofulvum]KXG53740.1 bZIP transcription factor, bZIP-1 [Penicillium griseofulvum]